VRRQHREILREHRPHRLQDEVAQHVEIGFTRVLDGLIADPARSSRDDLGQLFAYLNEPRGRAGLVGVPGACQYLSICSRWSCSRRASLGRFISTMQTPGQNRSMKPPLTRSSNRAPSARRSVP